MCSNFELMFMYLYLNDKYELGLHQNLLSKVAEITSYLMT